MDVNFNIIAYAIYLGVSIFITVVVGKKLHKNGIVYIQNLWKDSKGAHAVNNMLLAGYYLLNIGYVILMVERWPKIETLAEMLNELSSRIGLIVMLLAILHYGNIAILAIAQLSGNKLKTKK